MSALAATLLAFAASPAAEPPDPPDLEAYYFCVANRADEAVFADTRASRAADRIVQSAIEECASLRPAALAAAVRFFRADARVRQWVRQRNMSEEEFLSTSEQEFDLTLRDRLLMNISKLRRAPRNDNADY